MQYTQNTGPNGPDPTGGDGPTPPNEAGASGMGTAAAEKLAETRSAAAGGLDSAASALHQNAERLPGSNSAKSAARAAADALSSTADYVRENDFKGMLADVRKIVKNNPGPALLTAAVLGFLVARTFSRD